MKPCRMLIPVIAICLLLIGTHDSRSAILELVPTPVLLHDQAQQDAPLRPMYIRFHPRFYKEYGEAGLSSTLYLQNPNQMPGNYVLEFYDCVSGTLVFPPRSPDMGYFARSHAGSRPRRFAGSAARLLWPGGYQRYGPCTCQLG